MSPRPPRPTPPRQLHHPIHRLISHRRTMRFQNLADDPEGARGIVETVLEFLRDEVGVEDGAEAEGLVVELAGALGVG